MAIRKNKKRIDPRYFLHETTYRDEIEEGVVSGGDYSGAASTNRLMGGEDKPKSANVTLEYPAYQELADILITTYEEDPRKVQDNINACGEEGARGDSGAFAKCMFRKNTGYVNALQDAGFFAKPPGR